MINSPLNGISYLSVYKRMLLIVILWWSYLFYLENRVINLSHFSRLASARGHFYFGPEWLFLNFIRVGRSFLSMYIRISRVSRSAHHVDIVWDSTCDLQNCYLNNLKRLVDCCRTQPLLYRCNSCAVLISTSWPFVAKLETFAFFLLVFSVLLSRY